MTRMVRFLLATGVLRICPGRGRNRPIYRERGAGMNMKGGTCATRPRAEGTQCAQRRVMAAKARTRACWFSLEMKSSAARLRREAREWPRPHVSPKSPPQSAGPDEGQYQAMDAMVGQTRTGAESEWRTEVGRDARNAKGRPSASNGVVFATARGACGVRDPAAADGRDEDENGL